MVADVDGDSTRDDEEKDSSDDFFDAGEGAIVVGDGISLRAASENC